MNKETRTDKTLLGLIESIRTVSHQAAAKSQLEQAIFLWFHKDDSYVVSDETAIHTLAVAVQGVLWSYAHYSRQRPSAVTQRIEKLPPDQRARLIDSQNFFKHGNVGRKEKGKRKAVHHLPDLTDFFLCDNVCTFNRLFTILSPIMDMFLFRYSLLFRQSGIKIKTLEMKLVRSGHDLTALAALSREDFYEIVSPHAVENLREQKALHSGAPS